MHRALVSRDVFEVLRASGGEAAGVRLLRAHYVWHDAAAAPRERLSPQYAHLLRALHVGAPPPELGPSFAGGVELSHVVPVVDMALYLPYLERLVTALGGTFHWRRALTTLADAARVAMDTPHATSPSVVVNCAALGARQLCGDGALTPVRGVKVYVRCAAVQDVYCAEPRDAAPDGSFTTIIPRARAGVVACSGVAQPGATSLTVTQDEVDSILARCTDMLPVLRGAPVLGTWAGLRPLREAHAGGVRLEAEPPGEGADGTPTIVHNYGCVCSVVLSRLWFGAEVARGRHGGAGVVVSWGCAAQVARHAAAAVSACGTKVLVPRPLPPDEALGLPPLLLEQP